MQFKMKLQAAGLALIVLFLSIFGQDQAAHHPRKSVVNKELAHKNYTCSMSGETSGNLFIVNFNTNLVAVVNVAAAVAIAFDINQSYVAIFYGSTGNVIIISLESKIGAFTIGNSSHHGWIARSKSFEVYFKSLTSLEPLYKICHNRGETFTRENISLEISQGIKLATVAVNRNEIFIIQTLELEMLIRYSKIFVETLNGPLKGILKILGNGVMPLEVSLNSLITIFHTLGKIFSKTKGGVSILADLRLDWNIIYNSRSGSQSFIYLFSKLYEHNVDVKSIMVAYSDNPALLVAGLAGNSTLRTNRFVRILVELKAIILGKRTADSLIDTALLQSVSQSRDNCTTLEDFVNEVQRWGALLEKVGVANNLMVQMNYVHSFKKGHFVEECVDFYKITLSSFDSSTLPLQNVVNILSSVQKYINIESSVGFLLYRLIDLVVNRSVDVIRSLIPGVVIHHSMDFLVYVFRGAKLSDLKENLYEFLIYRPVTGPLLQIIERGLVAYNNITLKQVFARPYFRKYRCLITKTLLKTIRNAENGGIGSGGDDRLLENNNDGTFGKNFEVKNEQHKEKGLSHRPNQWGKNEQLREKHNKNKNNRGK